MQRIVRKINQWLLIMITLVVCALSIQAALRTPKEHQSSDPLFRITADDVVLMMYSNTARVGQYLVSIDEHVPDAAPYVKDGETLVPARFLAARLNAQITSQDKPGYINLSSEDTTLEYQGNVAVVRSHSGNTSQRIELNTAPIVKDGITYVPLRAASDALGRNLFVQDGIVFMTKNKTAPPPEQWNSWREELSVYIAYESFGSYTVDSQGTTQALFQSWSEAYAYATQAPGRTIKYRGDIALWDPKKQPPNELRLTGAPLILQLPDLPRGCEVTSLAMLLQHAGVQVDKMELANRIRKDPTPYRKSDGVTYFGNPHDGFVGNMYTFDQPGLGVYHDPIADLAEQYVPGRVVDLTGTSFEHLLWIVGQGHPAWVIHTTLYDEVPASAWLTWQTPSGPVKVTYYEHSMLVTGYDEKYVYVNDPLNRKDRIERAAFQRGWEQMGSQAIIILPDTAK
ncbi:C39 family peptidase [Paenibacillus marinisediminis]